MRKSQNLDSRNEIDGVLWATYWEEREEELYFSLSERETAEVMQHQGSTGRLHPCMCRGARGTWSWDVHRAVWALIQPGKVTGTLSLPVHRRGPTGRPADRRLLTQISLQTHLKWSNDCADSSVAFHCSDNWGVVSAPNPFNLNLK